MFGKSISQWEDLWSKRNKNIIEKATENLGKSLDDPSLSKKEVKKARKEAKKEVGSFYSYNRKQRTENEVTSKFFVTKKSIQPFLQADWFENFDDGKAQNILNKLKAQQDAIDKMGISTDSAKLKWEEYFNTASDSEKWQRVLVQDGNLVANNLDDVTIAQKNAAKAALQHDANLKQMTIGAKAANFAVSALKNVLHMAIGYLISWGINKLIQGITNHINRAKNAIEKMNTAIQNINSAQKEYSTNAKSLSEIEDRFVELSKGVNSFSENMKLSENEYQEYLDLSAKLADLSPDMVYGYNSQGEALLKIGNNRHIFNCILYNV